MSKLVRGLWVGCALAIGVAAGTARGESSAVAVIKTLNAGLEGVLRDAAKLGYQGRSDRLQPLLTAAFDLDFMAKAALGRRWKSLSAEQQQHWGEAFKALTIANYANRFDHYNHQRFEVLGEEAGARDTVVVRTRVIDPGSDTVELTYRMRSTSAGWQVIDIYLKGTVSEVALRRSEYGSVLKRQGFDELLKVVNAKVAELAGAKP